jgi:hypothetical protein
MPLGLAVVIWALWMGLIFGPHQNEKNFLDKDNHPTQCEAPKR